MVDHPRLLTERGTADGPPLSYWAFVPRSAASPTPLVLVHGSTRNTGRMFRAFLPKAIALDMPVMIPRFSAGEYAGYQRLGGAGGPLMARTALDGTLDDALTALGIDTERVDLCGFSGGAQFAHRYALFAPERVRRLVVASAGYYTYLESTRRYPYGVGPGPLSGGERPDVDAFLRIEMLVLVGEQDVDRGDGLRVGTRVDAAQGNNRLARALRWVDHLESEAASRGLRSRVSFDLLPGTAHSFSSAVHRGDLVTRVVDFTCSADPSSDVSPNWIGGVS